MAEKIEDAKSENVNTPSLEFEYATTTTLHGISRIAESRGARGKITWLLVLLIAGGFYTAVTVDRIQAYIRYDASTNVYTAFHKTLEFPAVTICNYNRFMNSKIKPEDKKYVRHLLQLSDDFLEYSDYDLSDYDYNLTYDGIFDDSFNYTYFAMSTGYSLLDSMHKCVWKGASIKCDASNFTSYYSPSYGQCYTFKAPNNQTLAGIGNGLRLLVDIEEIEYTETYSGNTEAGLKFAIHPRNELPLMDTMGLSAPPGFHTFVSMRQTRHMNLPKPWGVCGTDEATKHEPKSYSRNMCLSNCRRDVIINKCECQPLGYMQANEDGIPVPLCNLTQYKCAKSALEIHRTKSGPDGCSCPVACDYTTYESTMSMARYPSLSVLQETIELYENRGNSTFYDDEYVTKSMVYLDVYYNELGTVTYHQVEDLPFTALLGDLGGQLGLFLGASVITAVELLDYIMRRIKRCFVNAKVKPLIELQE